MKDVFVFLLPIYISSPQYYNRWTIGHGRIRVPRAHEIYLKIISIRAHSARTFVLWVEDDGATWAQPFLCFQDMLKKCKCECNFAWSKHPEHKSSCGEDFNWTHIVFRQKACMQIILISAKGKNRKKFWNIIDSHRGSGGGGNKDIRKSIHRQAKVKTTRVCYKPGNARKLIFMQ